MALSTLTSAPAPPGVATPTPLTAAYDRLAEVYPALRVSERRTLPEGGGWLSAAALAAGGAALEEFLAWDEAQLTRDYGRRPRPDVAASFGLHRYAFPAVLLVTVPWYLARRVPRLPPDAVALEGTPAHLAVRTGEFACLPHDPAAGHPQARVVPDEAALRGAVRAAVAEHLAPLLEGFRARMRRGARALWGVATDEVTEGLWYLGHLLGDEEAARRAAEALLPGGTPPFARGAAFRELTGPHGEALPTRDRASCCLFYTLRPEDTCVTCPRTCDAERVARLSVTT
jgi:ferric iron reductase protein FhuF